MKTTSPMGKTRPTNVASPNTRENLLTAWRQECYALSSPLLLKPVYDRGVVNVIHDTLERHFGLRYFSRGAIGTPLEKVSWLHTLLANPKAIGAFLALADVARLMLYAATLGEPFMQRLKELKKNPDNLRSYFFELYTYRLLDSNGIPNVKKPVVAGQELEGFCTLLDKEYLFECRKLYMPGVDELDVRMTIQTELYRSLQANPNAAFPDSGAIITVQLSDPCIAKNKAVFSQKISAFFKRVNARHNPVALPYEDSDEYGTFRVANYSLDRAMELDNGDGHDVYCILYPAVAVVLGQPRHHRVGGGFSHSVSQDKITEKLIGALKEKRRQHRASACVGKIYFFDNEILPEFRMALFGQTQMLDDQSIQSFIDRGENDEALCIITRNFRGSGAEFSMKVFCKSSHNALKRALERLVLSN